MKQVGKWTGRNAKSVARDLRDRFSLSIFLTKEDIKKSILKYFQEHGEGPTEYSGNASKYFGFHITWISVRDRLRTQGTSISKLCIEMGLKTDTSLTLDDIKKGILKYFKEHGKNPGQLAGDASKYFGFRSGAIKWKSINERLRVQGSSLPNLCIEMGLKTNTSLTRKDIKKGILKYLEEHGKAPRQKSGDASEYCGFHITWGSVDARLRVQGSSLHNLCIEMGLKTNMFSLAQEDIKKAILKYLEEHGKNPTSGTEDASKYCGFRPGVITWGGVNGKLGMQGSSISKLCIEMGLKTDTSLTLDDIKKGILKYFKEHGKVPEQRSGDASKYFGFRPGAITWVSIDGRLRLQGSSIFKLCAEMGLEIDMSDLTRKDIEKVVVEYFKEHGKVPRQRSGDASNYFGFQTRVTTWDRVNRRLRIQGSSLSKLCIEMGLVVDLSDLTRKDIKKGIRKYFKEHGKVPTEYAGDASKYGFPITWGTVAKRLRCNGYSLPKLILQMKKEGTLP